MKSYNPFKMWGSYIGLVSALSILTLYGLNFYVMLEIVFAPAFVRWILIFGPMYNETFLSILTPIWMIFVIQGIYGFYVGWIIHSIFRYFRRER